ncbi:MAG: hypothetical protein GX660_01160 [Clostridiaceae bacterium]|nr:hypothetical protein [Clostridiaceae bacterium]
MDSAKNILGIPEVVEGVGNIYPVLVKDYDEFMRYSSLLVYASHEQLDIEPSISILDLLVQNVAANSRVIDGFFHLFKLVLRKDVSFDVEDGECVFRIDSNHAINRTNFDMLRQVIMKQNLLYEPKKYKNKLVQEYAELTIENRMKNSPKISIESILTTVSVYKGMTYDSLANQTIYQLTADFKRICRMKDYERSVDYQCVSTEKIDIPYFAEDINLYVNPYDDIFVNKNKLKNITQIFK